MRGPDAGRYLEAMCTRDLSGLDPGGLRYGALLDDRARLVADFWIWRAGEAWWLEVESSLAENLEERLSRFAVADDVEVARRGELSLFHLEGPRVAQAARAIVGGAMSAESVGVGAEGSGVAAWAHRSRYGEEGVTVVAAGAMPAVWSEEAQRAGLVPASQTVQDSLRLEAGRVRAGVDFTERDLLPEAGLWGAVSLDKGCFPGQEIVRRVVSRGEVRRRLVGFVEEPGAGGPGGPRLQATSVAASVALGRRIGLGWVSTADSAPGTTVEVAAQGETLFRARVAALPLVSGPHAASPDVPGERVENTASR